MDKENLLTWAEHYIKHGMKLVPLPFREKRCIMEAWQKRCTGDINVIREWLKNGYPQDVAVL